MTIQKLLASSATLVYLFGKIEITARVQRCLRLIVHAILAIILLMSALISLSIAAYAVLNIVLPAALAWLFLGLVYALAAAIIYIRILRISRRI